MKLRYTQYGLFLAFAWAVVVQAAEGALRVPAFTAYCEPEPDGVRISSRRGVAIGTDPAQRLVWFGHFTDPGDVNAGLAVRVPQGQEARFRLTTGGQLREVTIVGRGTNIVEAALGRLLLKETGYQRFVLESLNEPGRSAGEVEALILEGAAVTAAHFNLKPRRNAASVHLVYPVVKGTNVSAFYCEMTGLEDPIHTYYMACGWHRGYFGMQVNSERERRIIFSVWDSGGESVDRAKVGMEDRVVLMAKSEGVFSGDFGNEGTGGHSHLKYGWKTGEVQRFVVTAQPTNETYTIYSGYYFHPERRDWMLISSWKAPREGGYLRGLYSFSENFVGSNGHLRRKALYGNQWIRTDAGDWIELTTATFSHDPTGKEDRRDRFMGLENGTFFLSHGGFVPGYTAYGERFTRPPTGRRPEFVFPK